MCRSPRRITITEIIPLQSRDAELPVISREFISEVARKRILSVCSGDILRIEQSKTVLYHKSSVSVTASLHGIQIIIKLRTLKRFNSFNKGFDILELPVFIIDSLTPVAHHLDIEHIQNFFSAHVTTDYSGNLYQFFFQSGTNQFPKETVMSGKSIRADRIIKRFMSDGITVFQYGIIPDT